MWPLILRLLCRTELAIAGRKGPLSDGALWVRMLRSVSSGRRRCGSRQPGLAGRGPLEKPEPADLAGRLKYVLIIQFTPDLMICFVPGSKQGITDPTMEIEQL